MKRFKPHKRPNKKVLRRAARAAPVFLHIGASTWTKKDQSRHYCRKLGTFGAAGPVTIIKPDD